MAKVPDLFTMEKSDSCIPGMTRTAILLHDPDASREETFLLSNLTQDAAASVAL
jgi:hypothetical protein